MPPGCFEVVRDWLLSPQRLKNWEIRERKKARDYSKETERDDERRRETVNASLPGRHLVLFTSSQVFVECG